MNYLSKPIVIILMAFIDFLTFVMNAKITSFLKLYIVGGEQ